MATGTIDGTVEQATVRRGGRGQTIYSEIRIRRDDGTVETLPKHVAASGLASALQPGSSGRFYTYKAIDHKGLSGFRGQDGRAIFAFPRTNEYLFVTLIAINAAVIVAGLAVFGDVWILPVLVIALCVFGWVFARKTHAEAQQRFDADGGR